MLKSILKPYYRKIVSKLRNSLHLDEHTRLLHEIIAQNDVLQKDRAILSNQLYMLSILLAGTEPTTGNDAFTLTPEDTARDLVNILSPRKQNDVETMQMLQSLPPDTFRNKSVCLMGTQNTFLRDELKKRGATDVYSVEFISYLGREQNQTDTIYIYPAHAGSAAIPEKTDILFVAHPAASSYLLKRRLFGIGAKITKKGLFVLSGTEIEMKRLEALIVASGFNQVQPQPEGKVATFDYVELREKPTFADMEPQESKLYMADKLPTMP